ncbi:hypothetical protein [Rhizobium sp. HT1-10]|uniref:hypothetical protein n=1 Tax=Rhizobium sp. HT1-10 TaxID=3111638 RepID=UPI003C147339
MSGESCEIETRFGGFFFARNSVGDAALGLHDSAAGQIMTLSVYLESGLLDFIQQFASAAGFYDFAVGSIQQGRLSSSALIAY